jgi:DNA polymerase
LVFTFDDEDPFLWVPIPLDWVPAKIHELIKKSKILSKIKIHWGLVCPQRVRDHIEAGGIVCAFNAQFERVVLNGVAGKTVNFPYLRIDQMRCTAVKARQAGMPENLGDACKAMGTYPKDAAGHMTMLQLAKPRKPSKDDPAEWWTIERAPEKYIQLWEYNVDDVLAERDLDRNLPVVSEKEWDYWFMDQRLNDRGVQVDLESVANFQFLIDQYKEQLATFCLKKTGFKPTQREEIANWIRANGWPNLTDMQADTVKTLVKRPDVPDKIKVILRLYSTYGMKAVTKYKTLVAAACADGRIRGMFSFYGAATTGRWSSKIVQLQNLFRPVIDDVDEAIDAVAQRDLEWIRWLYGEVDPMKVFASCIRGMLRAKKGYKLVGIDYSGIESRYGAWLFDEHWKVKVFRDYDTIIPGEFDAKGKPKRKGYDNYVMACSEILGIPPDKVTPKQRQQFKPVELALLYEGGVGAFVTMAANYNVDLAEMADAVWDSLEPWALESAEWMWGKFGKASELPKRTYLACDAIKHMWRAKHPKIVAGWKTLRDSAIAAVENPGKVFGLANKKAMFSVRGQWLVVLLPSGRKLRYFEPRVEYGGRKCTECDGTGHKGVVAGFIPTKDEECPKCHGEGSTRATPTLSYIGIDTDTRRWMRTTTYGGKWCENICQGGSSDFIRYGMKNLEMEQQDLIMTVHDEAISEVPDEFANLQTSIKFFTRKEAWAKDFPLAAEGFVADRFQK